MDVQVTKWSLTNQNGLLNGGENSNGGHINILFNNKKIYMEHYFKTWTSS